MLKKITLGTAGLGGTWHPVDLGQSVDAIVYALEKGITHIDMAPAYMDAEIVVGQALKKWKGKDLFLSTKVGKRRGIATQKGLIDYEVSSLKTSLERSLERLNREYVDLLFMHEPDQIPIASIPAVIDVFLSFKDQGLAKKLGMGGKPPKPIVPYIEKGYFDVVMDFNGYNLVERQASIADFPFYRKHKLEIYEGSPLMMGLLGSRLDAYTKKRPSWIPKKSIQLANEMQSLASKWNMDLSTMAHRFLLGNTDIDRLVIGPANFSQLRATMSDLELGRLENDLLKEINSLLNL